jgi:hypothetical protein
MQMEISIQASGPMIKPMVKEPTSIVMVQNMKVIGKMTSSTALVSNNGLTVPSTKVITIKARNTAMVN